MVVKIQKSTMDDVVKTQIRETEIPPWAPNHLIPTISALNANLLQCE